MKRILIVKEIEIFYENTTNIDENSQFYEYTDSSAAAPKREQIITITQSPAGAGMEDDFGFNEVSSFFEDAKNYNVETGQDE